MFRSQQMRPLNTSRRDVAMNANEGSRTTSVNDFSWSSCTCCRSSSSSTLTNTFRFAFLVATCSFIILLFSVLRAPASCPHMPSFIPKSTFVFLESDGELRGGPHWLEEDPTISRFRLMPQRQMPPRNWTVDEPRDTVFNATLASMISDYNNRTNCPSTKAFIKSYKILVDLFDKLGSPHYLTAGAGLGYLRDKDVVPWDYDIDMGVAMEVLDLLRPYGNQLPIKDGNNELYIDAQRGVLYPRDSGRFSCLGNVVSDTPDDCASIWVLVKFRPPLARKLDVSAVTTLNDLHVDAGGASKPRDWFFPSRPCTFMGIPTQCGNNILKQILVWYGNTYEQLSPLKICHSGRYVEKSQALKEGYVPPERPSEYYTLKLDESRIPHIDVCSFMDTVPGLVKPCTNRPLVKEERKRLEELIKRNEPVKSKIRLESGPPKSVVHP